MLETEGKMNRPGKQIETECLNVQVALKSHFMSLFLRCRTNLALLLHRDTI